jgi:hypothetical protein
MERGLGCALNVGAVIFRLVGFDIGHGLIPPFGLIYFVISKYVGACHHLLKMPTFVKRYMSCCYGKLLCRTQWYAPCATDNDTYPKPTTLKTKKKI